ELKNNDILYIGRKYALEGDKAVSLEYQTITSMNISFQEIKTGRLQRSFTKYTFPSLAKIPVGFAQAIYILNNFKPDVVVGFGGYVSVPVIMAADFLKIPTIIHEQTLEAGAANKFLGKIVDKVCISFEQSAKYFPKDKIVLTGNPIRKSISKPSKKYTLPSGFPILYITGGKIGRASCRERV